MRDRNDNHMISNDHIILLRPSLSEIIGYGSVKNQKFNLEKKNK